MRNDPIPLVLVGIITLAGCGDAGRRDVGAGDTARVDQDTASTTSAAGNVIAAMRDAAGKDLGKLTLADSGQSIAVSGRLTGLTPGEHAIHLHPIGRCEPPKFETAGDHWNPTNRQHGTKNSKGAHLGDFPNFTVGRDSSGNVQGTTPGGTLRGENALLDSDGAAVVVHAGRDDYRSQPSGGSGDKIACGVVR